MIQILTYSGKEDGFQGEDIILNSIHDANALDEFDINIISLADERMWVNSGDGKTRVNSISDLISLSVMISNSRKTKVVILFPQNVKFQYDYYRNIGYNNSCELKNMIVQMMDYIIKTLYEESTTVSLYYEKTRTRIGNEYINAAFHFGEATDVLLKADKSNKPTAINCGDVILSTLDLGNYRQIVDFLIEINLLHKKQKAPEWMEEIKMFDDAQQLMIIDENNQTIKVANDNIAMAMEKINKNNDYKSILYTTGEELVRVVFEILENMLQCDLSQFEDKKKEDFLFEKNGLVFIGEIKGVNHNVKSENISQLDVHYQGYLEDNEDINSDCVKALLIMNHQKNKALNVREPVHERQISLAERNGSLIIETITLLRMFEKYLAGDMSHEECLELLKKNTGLLKI